MAKKKKKTLGGLIKSISSGVKKGIKKVGKVIAKESANARRARGGSSKSSGSKGKSTPAVQKYSQRSAQVRNAGGISSYKAAQKEKKSVSKAKQTNWNNTFASRIKTPTGTTVADNMRAVGDYKRAKYGQSQSKQQQKDTRTVKDLQSWNTLSVDRQRQIGNMGEKNLNKAVNRYQNYYKVAAQQEAEKNRYKAGADPDKADSFLDVVRDKAAGKNGLIKGAGEHISEHYLKPLSKGKIGTVAMNALNDVGETTDYMALPLRALASQDNYVYGSKRLQSRKLIDGQTAWVYSGGKEKQKKLIELGAEKILNPNVRATYLEHKKEKAAIHEAGLDEEFEKFAKEYKERNHKKRNFGEKLKEAATTHKNYDPDSGNKALDIVVGAAGDPTTYLGIGAVGAAAKGAKAGAKAVGKAAAKKAGKEAAEIVEKGAVKNAVKAAAETGARKAGKEAVQDISGEVAKARVAAKDATKAAKPAVTTAEGREAIRIKAKMDAGLPVTEAEKKLYNDVVNRSVNAKVDKAGKEAVEARQAKQSTPNAKVGSSPKAQRTFSVKDKAKKAYATAKAEDVGTDSNLSSYVKESEVPEEMKPIFSAYKKSTNEKIKNAVINLRNGRPAGARTFEVGGTVKTTEGEVIKNLTGVDVTGYKHVLDSDRILHIEERHGIVGQENTTMKNANDIARVGYVIDNPDSIEYALDQNGKRRVSYQYGNSNHEPAPLIQYKKRVNGDIVVIEAVPDVSAKKLRIESMYFDTGKTKMPKNINGNPQVQNANNLPRTSKTESGLMPDSKIPPAEGKVNTLDPEYAEYAAKNRVKEPVSEGSVTREVASPMESEGRTLENVGKRNVKAYQFEHPEVKPYFESEARVMLGDLRNSVRGEKSYSDALYDVDGMGYTGTKRQTTDDIAALLDGTGFNSKGYSYQEIEDALEAIIKDNGAENNAASKRVEMMLDERLRNGYTSYDGLEIPASQEYIDMLHAKGIDDYGSKVFNERVDISNSSKLDKAAKEAVEDINAKDYNNIKGEKVDGKAVQQIRSGDVSSDTGRTADIRQADGGIQGQSGRNGNDKPRISNSATAEGLGRTRGSSGDVLLDDAKFKQKKKENGITDTELGETDHKTFSEALEQGKSSNKNGAYVDSKTVEDLEKSNAKTFLSKDGTCGVAVESNGNIVGAFKMAGSPHKGAVEDMIITARANGGTKMDCYGSKLVNMYEHAGFIPVARVPFSPEGIEDATLLSRRPDVYVLMKNGDDIDTVIETAGRNGYDLSFPDDLDKLPTFDDYDDALEYRNSLLKKQDAGIDINAPDTDWEKAAKDAVTNMEKDEAARAPETIKEKVKPDSELFDDAVKKADYEAEAEKIMSDNPKMGQNAAKQNVLYYTTEEANSMFFEGFDDGLFRKSPKMSQKEAREKVANMAEGKSIDDMARQFIGMDYTSDPHLFGAMAEKILPELSKRVEAGDKEALKLLMEVSDHANSIVSHGASMTNAAKMWVKMTPIGRCKAMDSEIARLNKQYGDRLKKLLELTDEQKALIYKAQTDEEIGRAVAQVTEQIWDEIPSTFWEKVNTARHIAMLLNIKTNLRNVAGNTAFASVRAMSNGLEYVITKSMKKTLDKYGGNAVRATRVTSSEMKGAKNFLDKEFDLNYSSNSNKYKDQFDMSRPEGKTVLESKVGSNVEKFTYWTLEKGDVAFFKPEYQKSYARYCKSKGIPLDKMSEMTELQRKQANIYAMREAEKATFRETTSASRALTKLKDNSATAKGKSVAGTVALRARSVALESAVPFVKTPINVFRQSVDYSPFGLLKSVNEMITFKKRGDVEALENAIHHMSTGLTGSGLTVLGAYLYSHGIVTTNAGDKSGDAYYDRDMGYQDYSLVIGNKSITIDWASPMQSSFFMGAQVYKMSEAKGMSGKEIMDGFLSLVSPHLDASFMSSAKDMMELFIQEADTSRDGGGIGSAILKTVGGSIPQNFISTLLPFSQLMSQTAGFTDDYQRDTRSTKEGTLEKSWDSWGKKMINRIPGLRQKYLNPKLDRRGRDVKSLTADSNVLTKFANAFINPSNVKQITLDDTDREIIKIYKGIDTSTEEGKSSKKYFFYNFTGNPDYDLTNGKRMTYDEAYTYGKSSRSEQNKVIQTMLKAPSYKNMTNQMKVDEIKSSYYIGKSTADMDTYGAKYACESLNRDSDKDAWKRFNAYGGKAESFMNVYLGKEKLLARAHDTSYYTKALAIAAYGGKKAQKAYDIHDNKIKLEKEYLDDHGSIREYSNAMCNVMSTIKKSDATDSMANKAVAAAHHKINKRTYKAMGFSSEQANMGIWFKKNGYSIKSLTKIKNNGDLLYDIGKKDGVMEYIDSLDLKSSTEKACLFRYLNSTANNPYGSIPNYLDMEDDSSGGSYGRRGYSRRGHRRGGGSGSGSSKNSNLPTWEEWVKQYITTGSTSSKSSGSTAAVKTVDSYLSEAYRKKQRKLVQKSLQ